MSIPPAFTADQLRIQNYINSVNPILAKLGSPQTGYENTPYILAVLGQSNAAVGPSGCANGTDPTSYVTVNSVGSGIWLWTGIAGAQPGSTLIQPSYGTYPLNVVTPQATYGWSANTCTSTTSTATTIQLAGTTGFVAVGSTFTGTGFVSTITGYVANSGICGSDGSYTISTAIGTTATSVTGTFAGKTSKYPWASYLVNTSGVLTTTVYISSVTGYINFKNNNSVQPYVYSGNNTGSYIYVNGTYTTVLSQVSGVPHAAGTYTVSTAVSSTGTYVTDTISATTSSVATNCATHIGTTIANQLRNQGFIPTTRPIWVIPTAVGGRSVNEFAGNGTSSALFASFYQTMLQVNSYWKSIGGQSDLTVSHMHWQQGEADGSTGATGFNTDATYVTGWQTLYSQLQAMTYADGSLIWSPQTTTTIGELGQWAQFLSVDTAAIVGPSNARNVALRTLGLGRDTPMVNNVSSAGLPHNEYISSNADHMGSAAQYTMCGRIATKIQTMGTTGLLSSPIDLNGNAISWNNLISVSNTTTPSSTTYLGMQDIQQSTLFYVANGDFTFPGITYNGVSVSGYMNVWSASQNPTYIRAPAGSSTKIIVDGITYSNVPLTSPNYASLGLGFYQYTYSLGSWYFTSLSPRTGNSIAYSYNYGSTAANSVLNPTNTKNVVIDVWGNTYVGLPGPTGGDTVTIVSRSVGSGTNYIGRAVNSVLLSAGGSGYNVGDTITLALGGATGTPATLTVATTSTGGAVATYNVTTGGCITSTTLPTTPAAPASTSGVGTGASFATTYNSSIFYGPSTNVTSPNYMLSASNQVVQLIGAQGQWRVLSDSSALVSTSTVKVGNVLPLNYSFGSISAGTTINPTNVDLATVDLWGGVYCGLPTPQGGENVILVTRSITSGTNYIGRAAAAITLASGGSGYNVGDTVTLALTSATGTSPIVTVLTTSTGGAIATFNITSYGCLTSTSTPTTPAAQSATSGSGTSATFNLSYSSQIFYGPATNATTSMYVMSTTNQVVQLQSVQGEWRVMVDSNYTGGGTSTPSSVSFTPTFTNSVVGSLTSTYTTQYGYYVKNGNFVTFDITLVFTPSFSTATTTGYWLISGLPSSAASPNSGARWPIGLSGQTTYGAAGYYSIQGMPSGTYVRLRAQGPSSSEADVPVAAFTSGTTYTLRVGGSYVSSS